MAELKTKPTKQSVAAFLRKVPDEQKREDAAAVIELMRKATKAEPVMWGTSIIGFGTYRYKSASGREGDWPIIGLSPRKQNLTLYIMPGFAEFENLLAKLGKHTTGSSCLYIKRLADIDVPTLKKLITKSIAKMKEKHR
ncbi:MAG: DUF1801 domain-containing protein [Alphaproteobacteria bacterium]|nr:DUF1801 domain-containing protein [Alphaproteobacteria bacterium]